MQLIQEILWPAKEIQTNVLENHAHTEDKNSTRMQGNTTPIDPSHLFTHECGQFQMPCLN